MTVPANGGPQEGAAGSGQQGQEPAAAQQGQTEPNPATTGGQEPPSSTGAQTLDPSTIEDPALRAYVERVQADAQAARREAANYRTAAQEARGKVQEYERANETEQQRVERERAELQAERDRYAQELRDLKVGGTVQAAATTAGAFDPALIYSLAQASLQFGADGLPTNVGEVLADLKRDKPFLFRRTDAGAGEGSGPEGQTPTGGGMNDWIRGRASGATR